MTAKELEQQLIKLRAHLKETQELGFSTAKIEARIAEVEAQYKNLTGEAPPASSITATISGSPGAQQAIGDDNIQIGGSIGPGAAIGAGASVRERNITGRDNVQVHNVDAQVANIGGEMHTGDIVGGHKEERNVNVSDDGIAVGGDMNVSGGTVAGHDIHKTTVHGNVGPGAVVGSGSVTAENIAGRDITIGIGGEALAKIFTDLNARVKAIADEGDRELAAVAVKQLEKQAEKVQAGDESAEAQSAVAKRLKNLCKMASDIGAVAIATLANPAAGAAMVIQKIAEKVQEEVKAETK